MSLVHSFKLFCSGFAREHEVHWAALKGAEHCGRKGSSPETENGCNESIEKQNFFFKHKSTNAMQPRFHAAGQQPENITPSGSTKDSWGEFLDKVLSLELAKSSPGGIA